MPQCTPSQHKYKRRKKQRKEGGEGWQERKREEGKEGGRKRERREGGRETEKERGRREGREEGRGREEERERKGKTCSELLYLFYILTKNQQTALFVRLGPINCLSKGTD
jgi:hypothetical protein